MVFVYGTLLRGERNHRYLAGSRLLGRWQTPGQYGLWSLGAYPAACPGNARLYGEVYRISAQTLARLDALEEVPAYYQRHRISTPWGPAFIYLQPAPPTGSSLLASGDWRRRTSRIIARQGFEPVADSQAPTR